MSAGSAIAAGAMPHLQDAVRAAIVASAALAGCVIIVSGSETWHWRSASFVGARVELMVEDQATPALDRWLATLPDADLAVTGHIVADIAFQRTTAGIAVQALVLEAAR